MKTSTKIILGLAAVTVVLCGVNAVHAGKQYKKYNAEALRVLAEMDAAPITTLDVTLLPGVDQHIIDPSVARDANGPDNVRQLNIPASMLANVSVVDGTMYVKDFDRPVYKWLGVSPALKKIVIHVAGSPDVEVDIPDAPAEEAETGEGAVEAAAEGVVDEGN
jgi:hypothetical protein